MVKYVEIVEIVRIDQRIQDGHHRKGGLHCEELSTLCNNILGYI